MDLTAAPPADLRAFISALEDAGDPPIRIQRQVSSRHELGAVLKKLEHDNPRVVMFENVDNGVFPVAINVFGTPGRIALALGMPITTGQEDLLREFDRRLQVTGAGVDHQESRAHEVVLHGDDIDLGLLPIGVFAAEQTEPYINAGILVARDPQTDNHNAGIYRMMKLDKSRLTVSVDPGHDFGKLIDYGRKNGVGIDFSLVLGAAPIVHLASQAKNPMSRDFYEVLATLSCGRAAVSPSTTNSVLIPTSAEIVVEGTILPGETAGEGPYGEFSYYYGSDPSAAVAQVTAITYRSDAIYQDIHPVHTEHRTLWLFPGREQNLLRKLREITPGIRDVTLPTWGAGMIAYISVRNIHDGDPRRLLLAALASDMFIKHAVVVDHDVDVRDPFNVAWAMTARFQPDRDIVVASGLRGYSEDPSGFYRGPDAAGGRLTSKIGYDATVPVGGSFPEDAASAPSGYEDLDITDYLPVSDLN